MVFTPLLPHTFHITPRRAVRAERGRDHEVDPGMHRRRRSRSGKWGRPAKDLASRGFRTCRLLPSHFRRVLSLISSQNSGPSCSSCPSCSLALHLEVPFSVPTGRLPLLVSQQLARSRIVGCIRPRGQLLWNLGSLGSELSQRNHFRPVANLSADVVRPCELGRGCRKGTKGRAARSAFPMCPSACHKPPTLDLKGPCAGNRLRSLGGSRGPELSLLASPEERRRLRLCFPADDLSPPSHQAR